MWAAAVDCRGPHADESDPSAGVHAAVRPTVTVLTPIDERPPRPSGPERSRLRPEDPAALLRRAKAAVRRELWAVGAFSLFINLLMLVSSIYMMEVFDRVLTSGSRETLFFLTLIALAATAVFGLLGSVRRKLLIRIGDWLERELGGPAIDASDGARLAGGGRDGGAASRALADIKAFFTSESVVAFLDAPWAPVFLAVIWPPAPGARPVRAGLGRAAAPVRARQRGADPVPDRGRIGGRSARAAAGRGGRQPGRARRRPGHAHGAPAPLAPRPARRRARSRSRLGDRGAALVSLAQFLRYGLQLGIMGLGAWLVLDGLADLGRDDRGLRSCCPARWPRSTGRCRPGSRSSPRAPGRGP